MVWDTLCSVRQSGTLPAWQSAHSTSPDVREPFWCCAQRVLVKCRNMFGSMVLCVGREPFLPYQWCIRRTLCPSPSPPKKIRFQLLREHLRGEWLAQQRGPGRAGTGETNPNQSLIAHGLIISTLSLSRCPEWTSVPTGTRWSSTGATGSGTGTPSTGTTWVQLPLAGREREKKKKS